MHRVSYFFSSDHICATSYPGSYHCWWWSCLACVMCLCMWFHWPSRGESLRFWKIRCIVLTNFIVFVYPRDIHFSHTKLLFEVTTNWQAVHSKFLAKSGDIFGNASCQSQLKYNWTQSRAKLKSKLIQSENKAYKTRQVTKCSYCVTVLKEKEIRLDNWENLISC